MIDSLESVLTNQWIPYVFYASSIATDLAATYLHVRRNGPSAERNLDVREDIEHGGEKVLLTKILPQQLLFSGILIGGLYIVDYTSGIHDAPINIHKTVLYLLGATKHLFAFRHFARLTDNRYLNNIAEAIEKATHNRLGVRM